MSPATPRFKLLFCLVATLLGVIAKFWLIAQSEIVDALDDPHEYILQILYPDIGGVGYPPGTGLIGRLFYDCGIPFRLGIEVLFIVACAMVLRALWAWPWRSYRSLGLFLFVLFNPNPAELFSHVMSDQVWLVESMMGLSFLVFALERETRAKWFYLGLAALLLGLTGITRSTFLPLMGTLIIFFALALTGLAFQRNHPAKGEQIATLFLTGWLALLGPVLIYEGVCLYDAKRHGYSGVSAIDCAEYKGFYTCLQSVGPAGDDTYFPVDEQRRNLIRQAGPASRQFIDEIEKNVTHKQVGQDHYGKADIPTGWFHFAAFGVVMTSPTGDLREAYAKFKTIEDEIATASRQGRLTTRFTLPLPDSRLHLVIAALPSGIHSVLRAMLFQPPPGSFAWKGTSPYQSEEFSKALTRRPVVESPTRERIWGVLCLIYGGIYSWVMLPLEIVAAAFFIGRVIPYWRKGGRIPMPVLAQQVFLVFFLIHLGWYCLFDASGLYVYTRYVVFQNVMLPVLMIYYLSLAMKIRRGDIQALSVP